MNSVNNLASNGANLEEREARGTPFILDGNFPEALVNLSSGQKRKIKGLAMTAINPNTWDHIDIPKAIKEGRLSRATIQNGIIKEIHVHPYWMEKIRQNNAWDIIVKFNPNESHKLLKESDEIGIGSVGSNENYLSLIHILKMDGFLKS